MLLSPTCKSFLISPFVLHQHMICRPLRLWWTENRELTQRYYNEVLHREGTAPAECNTAICLQIIEHHLQSSAMWVILPLQDWMSIDERLRNPDIADERINVPANPSHYWRYRMHISLDDLLKETTFNKKWRQSHGDKGDKGDKNDRFRVNMKRG